MAAGFRRSIELDALVWLRAKGEAHRTRIHAPGLDSETWESQQPASESLKGYDFSRAAKTPKESRALAPAEHLRQSRAIPRAKGEAHRTRIHAHPHQTDGSRTPHQLGKISKTYCICSMNLLRMSAQSRATGAVSEHSQNV